MVRTEYIHQCDLCRRELCSKSHCVADGFSAPVIVTPRGWWLVRPPSSFAAVLICDQHDADEVTLAQAAALEIAAR